MYALTCSTSWNSAIAHQVNEALERARNDHASDQDLSPISAQPFRQALWFLASLGVGVCIHKERNYHGFIEERYSIYRAVRSCDQQPTREELVEALASLVGAVANADRFEDVLDAQAAARRLLAKVKP